MHACVICVCVYVSIHAFVYKILERHPSSPLSLSPYCGGPADLIDVVEGGSFVWPVSVALFDTVLH